jgi:multiple sugar transport system substrate-binding protein
MADTSGRRGRERDRAAPGRGRRGTTLTRRRTVAAAIAGAGSFGAAATHAACGDSGSGGPAGRSASAVSGPLTFWANAGENDPSYPAWTQRLADFQRDHPQAVPRMEVITESMPQKLTVAVTAGTPPDVAVYDRYVLPAAAVRGLMTELTPLLKTAGIKGEDQQPWAWESVLVQGKAYGLPYSTDTRMLYLNAAHLKQAGLPTTAPRSLEDFVAVARRLTAEGTRIGYIPWANNWQLWGWGWRFGGDFYDARSNKATLDHPKVIAALDWEAARASELGYQAAEAFRRQQPSASLADMFLAGTVSALIQSTSFLVRVMSPAANMDWVPWAVPPPQGESGIKTWSGGFGAASPSTCCGTGTPCTGATSQGGHRRWVSARC